MHFKTDHPGRLTSRSSAICEGHTHHHQSGVALIVALILLVAILFLGLAAIRGTTVQQKMTANFYDREVAFQSAEAALQAAAATLSSNALIVNCAAGGSACTANPFNDTLPAGSIQTVQMGTGSGQFTAAANAAGQPQYVIENMGAFADASTGTGYGQTANASQYGAQGTSTTSIYYRITARSADPATVGDRAIVTLQAMYRQ